MGGSWGGCGREGGGAGGEEEEGGVRYVNGGGERVRAGLAGEVTYLIPRTYLDVFNLEEFSSSLTWLFLQMLCTKDIFLVISI